MEDLSLTILLSTASAVLRLTLANSPGFEARSTNEITAPRRPLPMPICYRARLHPKLSGYLFQAPSLL